MGHIAAATALHNTYTNSVPIFLLVLFIAVGVAIWGLKGRK